MASRTWVCGGLLTLGSPWCRRPSATVLGLLLLSLLVSQPSWAGVVSNRNVLFIPIDDLNDWVGFLGTHPQVSTPHMDRLAARGVIFSDAHCAAPVCNPSRAAVFSGKQPFNTGVFRNNDNLLVLQPNLVYLPEHFADNGYRTLGAGKQLHIRSSVIFQEYFNTQQRWSPFNDALVEYTAAEQPSKGTDNPVHVVNFDGQQFILPLNRMPSLRHPETTEGESVDWGAIDLSDDEWGDFRIADWAVSELAAGSPEPFFLACGFYRPHIPLWIPQRYLDMYPSASVVMPVVPSDDLDDLGEIAQLLTLERETIDLFQGILDYNEWEPAVAAYLACITFVDDQVGKLLDALDASAHANNTIIVLWSDHGFHLGEKNHFGKSTPWERSTRVPLVIVPAAADVGTYATGVTCDQPVSLLDLYPTLIELCGLPPKPELDGGSLVPLLQDPNGCADRPVLTTLSDNYTVRTQRWRFIHYEDGVEELYDRLVDPDEFDNLVGEQKYDYIRDRLRPCLPTFDGIDVCEIPDDSPGAVDDTFAVAIGSSDEPLDVLANDFCPNPAGTVTVVSVTQPTAGSTSVSLDNSQVLFTPAAAQSVQTFSYTMADETGAESSATATVLVAPAGIGELYVQPSDVAGTVSMEAENAQENLARSGYSWQQVAIGGDSGDFSMQTQPKDFQRWNSGYGANSPQLTFRIFFQQTGTYFVWLRALGVGGSANSLHVGFNGQEIPEGVNVTIPTGMGFVWEDDASPGPVTVSIPAVGVYNINVWPRETGTVLDKVLVTKDATLVPTGLGTAETPKVNLGGSGGNVAPQATDDMPDVIADSTSNALDVLTNDSDPDGDGFSIQNVDDGSTALGTVTVSGDAQSLIYTPPPTFTGTDTFTYTVVDDDATDPLIGVATVMVDVMPPTPNQAPTPVDDDLNVVLDSSTNPLNVLSNDSDPDGDGFSIQSVDDGMTAVGTVTVSVDAQSLIYTPLPSFTGTDTFTYTIVDDDAIPLTGVATVDVTVGAPGSGTYQQDSAGLLVMEAENRSSDSAATTGETWQETSTPATSRGVAMRVPGSRSWKTNVESTAPEMVFEFVAQVPGLHHVWFRSQCANGGANSIHYGLGGSVLRKLNLPISTDWVWSGGGATHVVDIPAPGIYFFSVWTRESEGGIDTILLTPDATALTPDELGPPESLRGPPPPNVAPTPQDDMPGVIADSTNNTLDVLMNDSDPDGDGFSIQSVDDGFTALGTVTVSGDAQSLIYTPLATFTGTDTFTYTIVDDDADPLTGVATVMVDVMPPPPNQSPTPLDDDYGVVLDSSANPLNVLSNDSDPDGDGFSIQSVDDGMTAVGTVTVSGDAQSLIYTPPATFTGTDTFTYTIVDDDTNPLTSVATVNVMVDALSGGAYQQDSAGLLVMEAENRSSDSAATTGETWQETSTPATSRGVAMRVPGSRSWKTNVESTAPEMVFEFVAQVPGLHHVWFRSQCANGGANSIHYGLGGSVLRKLNLPISTDWVWNGGGTTHVVNIPAPGTYFFSVWTRESASGIDTVLLTPDATALTPTELGPAESSRAP